MNYLEFVKGNNLPDNVILKAKELYEGFLGSDSTKKKFSFPKIKSITLKGLYPYKSDHEIIISNEKANIIYGGNGAGKTTAINSIEFGLLGSASDFEIKSNFSNRVINKFEVDSILEIDDKSYLLQRVLTPHAESHACSMKRISEANLDVEYEKYEGVGEVNALFNNLTGQSITDFAKIFDFFSLRVPRRHYLASNIHNTPGAMYRQKLFTKLLGHFNIANIAEESYKRWNQAKSAISQSNKKLKYLEPLQQIDISEVNDEVLKNLDNELNLVASKIKDLKGQRDELFKKYDENLSKEPKFEHHEELIESQLKLQKLEQIQQNEWQCEICESDFTEKANQRISKGNCPSCGQPDFAISHQEYNELRETIHQLTAVKQKYYLRMEKFKLIQNKIIKEIRAIEREIEMHSEKEKKLIQENNAINPGRTNDLIFQLEDDLRNYEDDEKLYELLYKSTKEFIEDTSREFIDLLNEKFSYYQRELFDLSKWALTPSFEVIADDGQSFKNMSHGEKNITDIIFRMAVLDSLLETDQNLNVFLIIDTPEEGLDAAFHRRFQPILFDFVKQHNKSNLIVLTSCERDFVDSLDPNYFRLENLLIKSSNSRPFQVTQLKLMQFMI